MIDRPVLPVMSIVITGAVTLVMLSAELMPLSLAAFKSTVTPAMLVVAAVLSTLTVSAVVLDAATALPARSPIWTFSPCSPALNVESVMSLVVPIQVLPARSPATTV